MRYLYKIVIVLVFATGFAMAQTGMQTPPTTPPTFPSQQQPQPGIHNPDENTGQTGAASTTALPKAQADIQSALRRQLPASADSVTVSVTDDNRIQLSGTVTSETEKNQIEQVARSAAPDLGIVSKLKVANSPSPTTMPPTGVTPNGQQPEPRPDTGTEKGTTRQPMPPMGSSFVAQQGGSSAQYPSSQTPSNPPQNPAGASGQTTQAASSNPSEAQGNIQKALQQDPKLANSNITVSTKGDKVELTGTVTSKEEKKTAKHIAEQNAGGMKVVDHLKVEGATDNNAPKKY